MTIKRIIGPHISGWRSSHTTAKALCFVAQFTLFDLVGRGHIETLATTLSSYKIFYKPILKMGNANRPLPLVNDRIGLRLEHREGGQIGSKFPRYAD